MKPRYKDRAMQKVFDSMLKLAEDPSSELYYNGEQHRGAAHRCAFWDGFSGKFTFAGPKRSAAVVPGTISAACFRAGQEFAKRKAKVSAWSGKPIQFKVPTDFDIEDSGKAMIVTVDDISGADPCFFLRLQSWDEEKQHTALKAMQGKTYKLVEVP